MGVPKFFRYISERYPCLSELAREQFIPEFDNLYLDMNGIIHNCSHPDDTNIHFNITEEEMFSDIFTYIDKLFFLIKPQKLFFMAIDGVAPRAKMNQQRSRRFRTAKDAETLEKLAINVGEAKKHERFDSNCITPGTEFMDRLHEALRYFIKSKISADPLWQRCRVILSGHNSPGEGEHKIMDYIRYLKSQSDFNPNTRHCLYGLDADLIILGLCTHEQNFVILREEVKFGKKTKKQSVEATRFFLLHLGLFREYLEIEFDEIKQQDPNFQIAKLIDDWVLMGFLIGNDFVPHIPCLHISSNALPLLYKTYKKLYPSLGGNINENGKLNLPRLEKYFAALAEVEFDIFQENYADLKYFEAKQSKNDIDEAFDFDVNEINLENTDNDLAALIESSRQFFENDDEDLSDNDEHINDEFENYKRNYYMKKLNKDNSNREHAKEQVICYITALQWILDYYYRGVQSWDWYYPHHYAPFISDLKGFQDYKIKYNMGKPFLPFQQLLAVLPAASKQLLPAAYRDLMTSASSDLINYYPGDFQTDLNGKKHEWEAVVLIPFIDEKILLKAMEACDQNLTPSERKRNQHGPMFEYQYHPESQGQVPGAYSFKSLPHVFCIEKPFWSKDILVSSQNTVCVELPDVARTVYFPGFPTMKHLSYKFKIENARVKVFDHYSRDETVILKPDIITNMDDVYKVAEKYLNQTVFIGWPYLAKSKVVGVSNKDIYLDVDGVKNSVSKVFGRQVKDVQEQLSTRMGIEFADYSVLVHVRACMGTTYTCGSQGKISINEVWSSSITAYPAQGVVSQIVVQNSIASQHKKIEQLFPENSKIFFVGNPYYGSEGVVMNPMLVYECGRLKVNITVLPEPDFSEAKSVQNKADYINVFQAATKIGLNVKTMIRIIGSVLVVKGARRPKSDLPENLTKYNIGLRFRYNKQQEELAGYATCIDNTWFLTPKAIALVQSYVEKFPVVFENLMKVSERPEIIFEEDLFPTQVGGKMLEEIVAWLKEQDHMKAEKVACGSKIIKKEAVEKILEAIEHLKALPVKNVKLQVKPHLLLKPDVSLPNFYKPKCSVKLFDRVVIVKNTYMVPLGSKGTVVGIYPVSDPNPTRIECFKAVNNFYEVLFDKPLPNGNDIYGIAAQRVYKVPESSILLIFTEDNRQNEASCDLKVSNYLDSVTIKSWRSQDTGVTTTTANNPTRSWRCRDAIANTATANNPPKPWKDRDAVTTNTSSGESCVAKTGKNPNIEITKVTQKCNNDFWMPAENTKLKYSNTIKIMQNSNLVQSNPANNTQQQVTAASIDPQQCDNGTQVLKSLLGLSANQAQAIPETAITKKPQLPQPPTSWRADAQKIPDTYHNFNRMPPPQHPQTVWQHFSRTKYYQGNHTSKSINQNLDISQDMKFNLNSLNQKGAFIPLQVSRRSFSTNLSAPTTSSNIQNKDISLTQNISELSLHAPIDANINQEQSVEEPTYVRKKPRIPKIGAKFDNN